MQMEKDKLEVEKSRLKMQKALLLAYLLHEGNWKKHEENRGMEDKAKTRMNLMLDIG